jgi:hypothetical protein
MPPLYALAKGDLCGAGIQSTSLSVLCLCSLPTQVLGRQMEAKQKRLLALQSAADIEVSIR